MTIDIPTPTTSGERTAIVSELTDRVLDSTSTAIQSLTTLLQLVDVFSVRHGIAIRTALVELPTVLDAIVTELSAVVAKPETWDRHK